MDNTDWNRCSEGELLRDTVALIVPLEIMKFQDRGGITEADIRRAQDYNQQIRSAGNDDSSTILYYARGETGYTTHLLCKMLATLAFCPGGVDFAGMHFEGKPVYEAKEKSTV